MLLLEADAVTILRTSGFAMKRSSGEYIICGKAVV
jgi:hypothetical protein